MEAIERWGDSFIEKIFEHEELENILPGKMYFQRLSARFAAKEAVIKAIAKEYPLALRDILILNRRNGAPYCQETLTTSSPCVARCVRGRAPRRA